MEVEGLQSYTYWQMVVIAGGKSHFYLRDGQIEMVYDAVYDSTAVHI